MDFIKMRAYFIKRSDILRNVKQAYREDMDRCHNYSEMYNYYSQILDEVSDELAEVDQFIYELNGALNIDGDTDIF